MFSVEAKSMPIIDKYAENYNGSTQYTYGLENHTARLPLAQYLLIEMAKNVELYDYMFNNVETIMIDNGDYGARNTCGHNTIEMAIILANQLSVNIVNPEGIENQGIIYVYYLKKLLYSLICFAKKNKSCRGVRKTMRNTIAFLCNSNFEKCDEITIYSLKLFLHVVDIKFIRNKLLDSCMLDMIAFVQLEDNRYLPIIKEYKDYITLMNSEQYKNLIWNVIDLMFYGFGLSDTHTKYGDQVEMIMKKFGTFIFFEDCINIHVFSIIQKYICHINKHHYCCHGSDLNFGYSRSDNDMIPLYKIWLNILYAKIGTTDFDRFFVTPFGNQTQYNHIFDISKPLNCIVVYLKYFLIKINNATTKEELYKILQSLNNETGETKLLWYVLREIFKISRANLRNYTVMIMQMLQVIIDRDMLDKYVLSAILALFFPCSCLCEQCKSSINVGKIGLDHDFIKQALRQLIIQNVRRVVPVIFFGLVLLLTVKGIDTSEIPILDKQIIMHFKVLEYRQKNNERNKKLIA